MKRRKPIELTRRSLLKSALVLGGGTAAMGGLPSLAPLANAQMQHPDAPPRHYIFCYFPGGWDILLSLDPRDPAVFTNGNIRNTQIQPAYDQLNGSDGRLIEANGMTFGPYIGDLANQASRLAVIRGMSMDTLTHQVGMRRFLTGKPPSGLQARGSSAATWLSSHFGGNEPIPNLSVRVESYNADQPNYASALAVNSVDDLLRSLRPANPVLPSRVSRQVDSRLVDALLCPRGKASQLWGSAEASRRKSREMTSGDYAAAFDFRQQNQEMDDLRNHYGFRNRFQTTGFNVQAAVAVQAITQGISRCASITVCPGLDTHFDEWSTNQGPNQAEGYRLVSLMAEDLASRPYPGGAPGATWLDHTVIVGFSEFSRTPLMNTRGGRDHSLTNACFLLGGNIRGGQIIGASSDVGMQPTATNLITGQPDPDGEVIRPEHVLQTLFDEVGIGEEPDLRVPECRQDTLNPCEQAVTIPRLLRG